MSMPLTTNEETVTMDEALSFIAAYCDWNPLPNERRAARRLIAAGLTGEELDAAHDPDEIELQDRIDGILYREN